MTGNGGAAVTLRGAALRFGHHVIWENLDLDTIYLAARLTGPMLRDHRRGFRGNRGTQPQDRVYARHVPELAGAGTPRSDEPAGQLDRHVPSGLGWPGGLAGRSGNSRVPARDPRSSATTRRHPGA